ncbi:Hypothetical protein FKW44_010989 [Caligus rogercresseyi]|uniref:Uncharacterized protein n=1 Tax=Caligus rogercresseyi TaxID=217165 RepID=A0A7T8HHD1_CALRO|nr:Hypothetical protein FKW44_010989 [Caligus rogercresseyi]
MQRDDLPSSHPPTSFKLIAAARGAQERTAKTKTRHPTTQSFHQSQITMIHIIHL